MICIIKLGNKKPTGKFAESYIRKNYEQPDHRGDMKYEPDHILMRVYNVIIFGRNLVLIYTFVLILIYEMYSMYT